MFDTQPDVDETVNDTKAQQWLEANTVVRYLYLSDAVQLMYDQGLIKSKLPARFFRYHNYHLWDRHISCFLWIWKAEKKIWFDDWALYVKKFASFIAEEEIGKKLAHDVNNAQRLVLMKHSVEDNAKFLDDQIDALYKEHNKQEYEIDIAEAKNAEPGIVYQARRRPHDLEDGP